MLSQLVHYRHLILSARVITLVINTQLCFMPYALMHSKSIFLGACFIIKLHSNSFPPPLYDLYWSALSEYPFWYIHTCIGHISSVSLCVMISKEMYLHFFLFILFVFKLGTRLLVLALNLNLHIALPQGTNRKQRFNNINRYIKHGVKEKLLRSISRSSFYFSFPLSH